MSESAQGTIGAKTKDKEAERFICMGSFGIKGEIPRGSQRIQIPDGAEYARAKKRKIGFYIGMKPENNGYTMIPLGARIAWLPDYKDNGKHTQYGEFSFE